MQPRVLHKPPGALLPSELRKTPTGFLCDLLRVRANLPRTSKLSPATLLDASRLVNTTAGDCVHDCFQALYCHTTADAKMPMLNEDKYLNDQVISHNLAELEDSVIGVHATYWLGLVLDNNPAHEPLLSALGGMTGIERHIEVILSVWGENRVTPLFIFDGQSLTGQDDVSCKRAQAANEKTNHAWKLYSESHATEAVSTFGQNPGMAVRELLDIRF